MLTTIGDQEVHLLSHAGRVFNVIIMMGGVALVFLAIGSRTQALLEFELQNFFGRRRMRDIGRLNPHYIICGAGRVGRSAARELARRPARFVIIENNETKAQKFAGENWLMLGGDATVEQTLRDGQIDRASEDMAEKHLRSADADAVVCPYVFAGQRIPHSFLSPRVGSCLDTATTHLGTDLEICERSITPRPPSASRTSETSRILEDRGVVTLAIKREAGMRFNPEPDDRIEAGDSLIAMGEPQQLREREPTAGTQLSGSQI
jgi:voltage-gated potassium channel